MDSSFSGVDLVQHLNLDSQQVESYQKSRFSSLSHIFPHVGLLFHPSKCVFAFAFCMHSLRAKLPEWLRKLNTIIKIYSDAHLGLSSKCLVQSTDGTHVPIREPEKQQHTHTHTHTRRHTIPFSYHLNVSLSCPLRSFYIFTVSCTFSLTHMCTNTTHPPPHPLGRLPLAFTAARKKMLK